MKSNIGRQPPSPNQHSMNTLMAHPTVDVESGSWRLQGMISTTMGWPARNNLMTNLACRLKIQG